VYLASRRIYASSCQTRNLVPQRSMAKLAAPLKAEMLRSTTSGAALHRARP
ncbi:uncharacterized protein METZ01_LOCUS295970, partial [marine metagenome]